jgi:UDP-3-O-[3-hydroxymyristoyl] glucosamine N-acyltransferase
LAAERIFDASTRLAVDGRMPGLVRSGRELTVGEIAKLTCSKFQPADLAMRRIDSFAALDIAVSSDIAFLDDEKYLAELAATRAGACFVAPRFAAMAPPDLAVLLNDEPYRAFVTVARTLFPGDLTPSSLFETRGCAAGAHAHASARVEAGVSIDPLVVIGPRAEVGTGTLLAAGATLGPDVCVGRQCSIGAGATIQHALIGDRVVIQPGARIGLEGGGYLPDPQGHRKIPQIRRIIVQDDVEIGANATVDRGFSRDTVIGEGTKIDNLVQIAQNVSIGRHCLIAAQAGIGENATVGDFVMIGGRVDIGDNVAIGDGAVLAWRSRVRSDVPTGGRFGHPSGLELHGGGG